MTVSKRTALVWWVGGLIAFAITLTLHAPLITDGVPGGILDHQSAPDAATVDAIQGSWARDGLMNTAAIAMISDLIFIGIFGIGCVLAGLYYRSCSSPILSGLGVIALASGVIFLVTDYGETISQFVQLRNFAGDDQLASLASTLRPFKIATWISGFLAVLTALVAQRFSTTGA